MAKAAYQTAYDLPMNTAIEAFDVSPLQYLQTRRLLTAKQLLTDTNMPAAHIAHAIGFEC